MILTFALKNPQATAEAVKQYNDPGQIDVLQLRPSFTYFAMHTLRVLNKTS